MLVMRLITQERKETMNKSDIIKRKTFYTSKDAIKKVKDNSED